MGQQPTTETKTKHAHQQAVWGIRPTSEEIEADLAEIFTPEELAEIDKVDLSSLPQWPGQKSLSEMINEDRF